MSDRRVFVDTNILVYAYDRDAGGKHKQAESLMQSAWNREFVPVISVQVLQEFLVTLLRKGVASDTAVPIVADYTVWRIEENNLALFRSGTEVMRRFNISLWDSMIIAAAERAQCGELWTEDLNSGQMYGTVRAVNPFD